MQGNDKVHSRTDTPNKSLSKSRKLSVCMQHDYKGFSPGVTMESVTEEDWRGAPALQETPVTSAICEPANGARLEEGTQEVPGVHFLRL